MRALDRKGVEFSIAVKQSKTVRALIEQIPESDWIRVSDYPETGEAQLAETRLAGWRLIVRRTRLLGAQAELFPDWRHHCLRPTGRPSRPASPILITAITRRSNSSSATSRTRRWRTSPPATMPPTAPGP
jgi:hypothetical protein